MPSLLRCLQRWTCTIHSNTTLSTSQCFDMAPGPTPLSSSSRLWATGNLSWGVGEIRRGGKEMGCWLELALGAAESLPVQLCWLPDSLMERVEASPRPKPPSLTLMLLSEEQIEPPGIALYCYSPPLSLFFTLSTPTTISPFTNPVKPAHRNDCRIYRLHARTHACTQKPALSTKTLIHTATPTENWASFFSL